MELIDKDLASIQEARLRIRAAKTAVAALSKMNQAQIDKIRRYGESFAGRDRL